MAIQKAYIKVRYACGCVYNEWRPVSAPIESADVCVNHDALEEQNRQCEWERETTGACIHTRA